MGTHGLAVSRVHSGLFRRRPGRPSPEEFDCSSIGSCEPVAAAGTSSIVCWLAGGGGTFWTSYSSTHQHRAVATSASPAPSGLPVPAAPALPPPTQAGLGLPHPAAVLAHLAPAPALALALALAPAPAPALSEGAWDCVMGLCHDGRGTGEAAQRQLQRPATVAALRGEPGSIGCEPSRCWNNRATSALTCTR